MSIKKNTKETIQTPKGTHDILPVDEMYWEYVRHVASDVVRFYGFGRIETPSDLADDRFFGFKSALRNWPEGHRPAKPRTIVRLNGHCRDPKFLSEPFGTIRHGSELRAARSFWGRCKLTKTGFGHPRIETDFP